MGHTLHIDLNLQNQLSNIIVGHYIFAIHDMSLKADFDAFRK